jgi:hypothetical protein
LCAEHTQEIFRIFLTQTQKNKTKNKNYFARNNHDAAVIVAVALELSRGPHKLLGFGFKLMLQIKTLLCEACHSNMGVKSTCSKTKKNTTPRRPNAQQRRLVS